MANIQHKHKAGVPMKDERTTCPRCGSSDYDHNLMADYPSVVFNGDLHRCHACGALFDEAAVAALRTRCATLEAALKAAKSIMWMAKNYAEAGGTHGPEMRDYNEVESIVFAQSAVKEEPCQS